MTRDQIDHNLAVGDGPFGEMSYAEKRGEEWDEVPWPFRNFIYHVDTGKFETVDSPVGFAKPWIAESRTNPENFA